MVAEVEAVHTSCLWCQVAVEAEKVAQLMAGEVESQEVPWADFLAFEMQKWRLQWIPFAAAMVEWMW